MEESKERREYPRINKIERREFQRVVVKLETELEGGSKYQISGWTRDLSIKGIFVMCSEQLPEGARCLCRMSIGPVNKGAPVIEVTGKVVRFDAQGIAVQFSEIATESFKRFRDYFIA